MDMRYMAKQCLGQITTSAGVEMQVFATGKPSWYLFCPMQRLENGAFASGTLQFPYHGNDLVRGWKRRLH
ncbi:hypothetical protein LCGC14_0736040 [marine sediment metagenome]|uniref:Uncharacterized protein n=1 Tax=marine sediment metagenome TaxID=412755 RepID=A0A0F9QT03_9ZZZZ